MSKLEKLIEELCPAGVEYKTIEEICEIRNGYTPSKKSPKNWNNGDVPWFRMEDIRTNGNILYNAIQYVHHTGVKGEVFPADSIIFATTATIGAHALIKVPFLCNQQLTHIHIKDCYKQHIDIKFLFHYADLIDDMCKTSVKGGGTLQAVSLAKFKKFIIPLPPLPVQEEIVRILDNFTELTAELTAELTDRKKQYEYYRDSLLGFGDEVPKVKLSEISTNMFRGTGITRDQVTEEGVPCVRYGEIYTAYSNYFDKCVSYTDANKIKNPKYFSHGDILFAITGESVEDIAKSVAYVGDEKCLAGGDILVLQHEQNPKYLAYALSTYDAKKQKSKGKIKSKVVHSNSQSIGSIEIPLPPLSEQQHIVDILDRFDTLCNDISKGLPAEIEERQKQYEYYRDKLLTFKRKEL